MRYYFLLFLGACFGCKVPTEASFLSDDVSISEKFYFVSSRNKIDKSRPITVLCPASDSIITISAYQTVGFDSTDYLFLDRPFKIPNQIDSAVSFNERIQVCNYPS